MTITDTDLYHISFPKDSCKLKAIVGSAYFLEVFQVISISYEAFRVYAKGWGDFDAFDAVGFDWFSAPILIAISAYVQCALSYESH